MRPTMRCSLAMAASCATTLRAPPPQLNFFAQFFQPPPTPADIYAPDATAKLPGLPKSYDNIYAAAAKGVLAAINDELNAVEVDFPPITNVNRLSSGSARDEEIVHQANAEAALELRNALNFPVTLIGCSGGARTALRNYCGEAYSLRDGASELSGNGVAIIVQPTGDEQWEAAEALSSNCRCVIVLNGLLGNGALPHAYYYKPMTGFSQQTGGVVRAYPGAYRAYDIGGKVVEDLEIKLTTQGRRALPDTKDAQMTLQTRFGRQFQ